MIELKVFYWFLKAIFCGLFQVGNKQWRIAGKELISKPTFRLPDSAAGDRLVGFRLLKRTFVTIKSLSHNQDKKEVLIFEADESNCETSKEYVIWQGKYNIDKISCYSRSTIEISKNRKAISFCLLLLSLILIPATIISKSRVQYALIFTEFIEAIGLLNHIKQVCPKTLHFFNTSEKDANILYLIIKKASKLNVFKHPSPGALIAHNQNLMTDVLVLSSKYQVEEYNLMLKETIKCKEVVKWPPEYSKKYLNNYGTLNVDKTFKYLIGFYSHGGWLRKKTELTNALFANPDEEEECLKTIAKYINQNDLILKVYLHPKEKKYITEAKKYYLSFIEEGKLSYFTSDESSSSDFNSVKIGICAYSAILFERNNLGLETLVWREKNNNFPLYGTSLYDQSFNNYEELLRLINKIILK